MVLYDRKYECRNSTNLDTVYYNEHDRELYVEFLNGSRAGYKDVPRSAFDAFAFTESAGKYYNQYVRGKYKGTPVSEIVERPARHLRAVPDQNPSSKTGSSVAMGTESRIIYGESDGSLSIKGPLVGSASVNQSFTVRGYVFAEDTYEAGSVEEAVQMFLGDYEDAVVKEVVVSFE